MRSLQIFFLFLLSFILGVSVASRILVVDDADIETASIICEANEGFESITPHGDVVCANGVEFNAQD